MDDPGLFAALGDRLDASAPALSVEDALDALVLLGRVAARSGGRARRAGSDGAACAGIYGHLMERAMAHSEVLAALLATLARGQGWLPGGGASAAMLRRLAAAALELRSPSYRAMASVERSFEALAMLYGPLKEVLMQRRTLFLETAPLSELFRALREPEALPPELSRVARVARAAAATQPGNPGSF